MGQGLSFCPGRGDYYHLTYKSPHGDVTFLKPTSYMNLSGVPIRQIQKVRDLSPDSILIVCDDVALPLGALRIRRTGSDGGHKGLASVIAELGSEQVPRLRIGIYTGDWPGELSDYVLTEIPTAYRRDVDTVLTTCSQALDCILNQGLDLAMNRFNRNVLASDEEDGPVSGGASLPGSAQQGSNS